MPIHGSGGGGNIKDVDDYPNNDKDAPEHEPHSNVFSRFLDRSEKEK